MECVIQAVAVCSKHGNGANGFSLDTTVSSLDLASDSRTMLIKVEYSNIETIADSTWTKKLLSSVADVDSSTTFKFPIGNCVVGSIVEIGDRVEGFQVGDEIIGLLPPPLSLDKLYSVTGLSTLCFVDEFYAVQLPSLLSSSVESTTNPSDASTLSSPSARASLVCVLPLLVKAIIALHYQSRLVAGESILVLNAGTAFGLVLVQLAALWGYKVLAVTDDHDSKYRLERIGEMIDAAENIMRQPPHVIDLGNARPGAEGGYVLKSVMDETNGIGVDCVIDLVAPTGSRVAAPVGNSKGAPTVTQRDLISCLATTGRWLTENAALQLDPPESEVLFLKGASLSFLFMDHWLLCPSQMGRLHHVIQEALRMIVNGDVKSDVEVLTESWAGVVERLNAGNENDGSKPLVFQVPSH